VAKGESHYIAADTICHLPCAYAEPDQPRSCVQGLGFNVWDITARPPCTSLMRCWRGRSVKGAYVLYTRARLPVCAAIGRTGQLRNALKSRASEHFKKNRV
jgi:hypothetical protein